MRYIQRKNIQILLASLSWGIVVYFLIGHLKYFTGIDAYYHVEIAEIMRSKGIILSDFPWADCSIWKYNFFDKDWLFHIYLIPFLFLGKLLGGKAAIIIAVLFAGITWGCLLKALKIQHIFLTLILFLASFGFVFRLTMCRGHLLSIVFLPICLIFMIKRKRLLFSIVVIVYSLAYTGAWQILPIAVIYDFICNYKNGEKIRFTRLFSIYALLGLLISIFINPYFPNNIYGQIIQNLFVLKINWFGGGNVQINLGHELNPMTDRRLFSHFLIFVILIFITWGNYIKRFREQNRINFFCFSLSIIYFILSLISVRFVEYSVPLGVVLIAKYWDERLIDWKSATYKNRNIFIAVVIVLMIYVLGVYVYYSNKKPERESLLYSGVTNYLNKQLTEKQINNILNPEKIVFTADWDDAPALFYGVPQYKYLVFLDPCFMYIYSPEKYRIWYKISEGKSLFPVNDIIKNFKADYIFLTKDKGRLNQALSVNDKVKLVYEGQEKEKLYKIIKYEK